MRNLVLPLLASLAACWLAHPNVAAAVHTVVFHDLCVADGRESAAGSVLASHGQDGPVTRLLICSKVFMSAAGAGSRAAGARAECGLPVELRGWLEDRQSIAEEWILLTDVGYSFM